MKNRIPRTAARVMAVGIFLTASAVGASAEEKPSQFPPLPKTVTVLGRPLALKTFGDNATEALVAEYAPAKETLDHWTLLVGVRIFKDRSLTPEQAVAMKEKEVEARKAQGDVMANSLVLAKGNLKVIDFVVSQAPIVEHNVMSFSRRPDGQLASHQIARRYYRPSSEVDDGLRAFMGAIQTNRAKYVREVERLSKEIVK